MGGVTVVEGAAQVSRAPSHLEAAGQHAVGAAALLDALLHDGPDPQQPGAHLLLGAPGELVGQHHLADRQPRLAAARQQLRAGRERVAAPGCRPARSAAAPSRPRRARSHRRPSSTRGSRRSDPCGPRAVKRIPLVWKGSRLRRCRTTSSSTSKATACRASRSRRPDSRTACTAGSAALGSTSSGDSPSRPEHHGLDAAVAVAGGTEGAEQLRPDAGHVLEQPVLLQGGREGPGGPHRAHGVRARRADPDGEEVEDAQCHDGSSWYSVQASTIQSAR